MHIKFKLQGIFLHRITTPLKQMSALVQVYLVV